MIDYDQQARASENFAGPVDFETPQPDLPVHFLNFHKPWWDLEYFYWPSDQGHGVKTEVVLEES